jgi:hypothetical protein
MAEIRAKLETADDALTRALDKAHRLDESPSILAQAMKAADLADALAGKAEQIARALRDAATPPVGGAT